MEDFMEVGGVIPLEGGWFLDKATNVKFRYDEDGNPVGPDGRKLNKRSSE